jgi:hypothetical protein
MNDVETASAAASAELWGRIEASPLAVTVRESLYLYPALETLHIWGFVTLVGAVVMFDVRVLGLSRRIPVDDLARHLLPWSVGALIVIVPTGLLMFLGDAGALVANPAFLVKLSLIFLAGCNAAAFHLGPLRTVAQWRTGVAAPHVARFHAVVSLVLWLSVIVCGRLIAYV